MKKKRIRYSEFGATPDAAAKAPTAPAPVAAPSVAEGPRTEEMPVAEAPPVVQAPHARPKRVSTPVELARALAAAQAKEARERAGAGDTAPPTSAAVPAKEELVDLLMFRVGAEQFAVELLAVEEVIDLPVIHHVPEMPPAMVGVVTVRGSLTPVYSPNHSLGLPLALSEALLIFRRGGARVGVLIDDVEDAISVDLRMLREAPGMDDTSGVVLGVIRHAGALVAVVDADALIAACQTASLLETA